MNLDPDGGVKDLRFPGVIALSFGWTGLLATPMMAAASGLAFALAGGPLLWRFLNYRPVTRRALLRAALNFVATGCWITFGSGAINAYERGLISLPMSIVAVAVLFAVVAGGSHVMGDATLRARLSAPRLAPPSTHRGSLSCCQHTTPSPLAD